MENQQTLDQSIRTQSADEADLRKLFVYFEQELSDKNIERKLIKRGFDEETAEHMVMEAKDLYKEEILRGKAKKDIIFGALWCVGGTVATLANIGFIFWGAIVFGFIQMVRGFIAYSKG